MKESFIFYRSFYEALKELSKEDRVEIIDAICELALNEKEVELKGGIQKAMFALMKPQIEANNKRYANGCKAKQKQKESEPQANQNQSKEKVESKKSENKANNKRTRSKAEAKAKQTASKGEANENVNDNENVNENEKDKGKALSSADDAGVPVETDSKAEKIPYNGIISYLNHKTGKHFDPSIKATRAKIKARWSEGFRPRDFERVIDVKVAQWLGDEKMDTYLRPDTLFGTKFESYLNENMPKPKTSSGLPDWYSNTQQTPATPEQLEKVLAKQRELAGPRKTEEEKAREAARAADPNWAIENIL